MASALPCASFAAARRVAGSFAQNCTSSGLHGAQCFRHYVKASEMHMLNHIPCVMADGPLKHFEFAPVALASGEVLFSVSLVFEENSAVKHGGVSCGRPMPSAEHAERKL